MMESNIICPECFTELKEKEDKIVCPQCGATYNHGDTLILPLKQIIKMKTKEKKVRREQTKSTQKARLFKKKKHSTGFYGVSRVKPVKGKPRGCWRYRSKVFGINILRVNLDDLKRDVLEMGGEWKIVNEKVAEKSIAINERYKHVK